VDCNCKACQGLNRRYKNDPVLLAHYRKKLLVRGWAGKSNDPVEKAYVLAHAEWARKASERCKTNAGMQNTRIRRAISTETVSRVSD